MLALKEIDKRLRLLQSADPRARDTAAAEIGDYLEADVLPPACIENVLRRLMAAAIAESDEAARESLFNALSTAAEVSDTSGCDWDLLAQHLDELPVDCLEHALVILGFSGNRKYRAEVEKFVSHPQESIRAAAADSLAMLETPGRRGLKSAR